MKKLDSYILEKLTFKKGMKGSDSMELYIFAVPHTKKSEEYLKGINGIEVKEKDGYIDGYLIPIEDIAFIRHSDSLKIDFYELRDKKGIDTIDDFLDAYSKGAICDILFDDEIDKILQRIK